MRVEKVELYKVNGYDICTKSLKDMENYLSDVPKDSIETKEYVGEGYIVAIGKEFKRDKCKEVRHLKFNNVYETKDEAESFIYCMKVIA